MILVAAPQISEGVPKGGCNVDEAMVSHWRSSLLAEEIDAVCHSARAVIATPASHTSIDVQPKRLLFPGAFDPLHAGHLEMADIAGDLTGLDVEFEISIHNVDKPPPSALALVQRLRQFPPDQPVWLTRAMRFLDKATLFPNATFVVGADTLLRIADRRYYDDEEHIQQSIAELAARDARFLVFARRCDGVIYDLATMDVPTALQEICSGVPRSRFCQDISSTEIRIARNEPGTS